MFDDKFRDNDESAEFQHVAQNQIKRHDTVFNDLFSGGASVWAKIIGAALATPLFCGANHESRKARRCGFCNSKRSIDHLSHFRGFGSFRRLSGGHVVFERRCRDSQSERSSDSVCASPALRNGNQVAIARVVSAHHFCHAGCDNLLGRLEGRRARGQAPNFFREPDCKLAPVGLSTSMSTQSIAQVSLLVRDYDEAIEFFTQKLNFRLLEDTALPKEQK